MIVAGTQDLTFLSTYLPYLVGFSPLLDLIPRSILSRPLIFSFVIYSFCPFPPVFIRYRAAAAHQLRVLSMPVYSLCGRFSGSLWVVNSRWMIPKEENVSIAFVSVTSRGKDG